MCAAGFNVGLYVHLSAHAPPSARRNPAYISAFGGLNIPQTNHPNSPHRGFNCAKNLTALLTRRGKVLEVFDLYEKYKFLYYEITDCIV